jgi:hypothetical protein
MSNTFCLGISVCLAVSVELNAGLTKHARASRRWPIQYTSGGSSVPHYTSTRKMFASGIGAGDHVARCRRSSHVFRRSGLRQSSREFVRPLTQALSLLTNVGNERALGWKCTGCGYIKHFTKPVSLEAVARCPRCKSEQFVPLA